MKSIKHGLHLWNELRRAVIYHDIDTALAIVDLLEAFERKHKIAKKVVRFLVDL